MVARALRNVPGQGGNSKSLTKQNSGIDMDFGADGYLLCGCLTFLP